MSTTGPQKNRPAKETTRDRRRAAMESKKLGTFLGVFTPTLLTILGVIMYLRFGWMVGHVGLFGALAIVEGVTRLLPGVVGNPESIAVESFRDGLLEEPQYTRPAEYRGWRVPEILLSGDHGRVAEWRRQQRRERTRARRPDLLDGPERES